MSIFTYVPHVSRDGPGGSRDDDVVGEPDGVTGGADGVGYVGHVICVYSYVRLSHLGG